MNTQTSHFYKTYLHRLKEQYPSAAAAQPLEAMLPVSPFVISLPKTAWQQIKDIIKILYDAAKLKKYMELIPTCTPSFKMANQTSGLLMSYDFHFTPAKELKLIEVNTNSSGFLVSELVSQIHGLPAKALSLLKKSFEDEWQSFAQTTRRPQNKPSQILIVDHQIKTQKMYIEFLMYQDFINRFGWNCTLCEISRLKANQKGELAIKQNQTQKIDMLYNRSTDFYFQNNPAVKKAFLNKTCAVSPHPTVYLMLADKARLCDWSSEDFLNQLGLSQKSMQLIQKTVPLTRRVNLQKKDFLWQNRKTLFFKPLNSYGGKAVYKGKTLTKKTFQAVLSRPGVYQTAIAPGVFTEASGQAWKYDLRAYAYKNQLLHLTARVYQGAVTGFGTPGAGFAAVLTQ